MADKSQMVQVRGLAEFQRELKKIDLVDDLKDIHRQVATNVATKARALAESLGGVAAKAAPDIKVKAEQRYAKLTLGSPTAPWDLGAEFGGGARPTTQQFKPYRGNGAAAGYFLYPTVRSEKTTSEQTYDRALGQLLRRAFPD